MSRVAVAGSFLTQASGVPTVGLDGLLEGDGGPFLSLYIYIIEVFHNVLYQHLQGLSPGWKPQPTT